MNTALKFGDAFELCQYCRKAGRVEECCRYDYCRAHCANQRYTWGVFPTLKDFLTMFAATGNDEGTFPIRLGPQGSEVEHYNALDLWAALHDWAGEDSQETCYNTCDHETGCDSDCRRDLAGSVMYMLGFEWV